jgi:LPP20 lipoprotein
MKTYHVTGRITGLVVIALVTTFLMSFSGCGASKGAVKGEKEVTVPTAAPEWVGSRPHNSGYYIGIGTSSKTAQPLDYQAIAKKNALNDLASEISVRVQGETFLNSLEVNKNFSEEFISTISTTTDEKIEDYEIAGQWESDKEYWVYYRLNKAQFQQQKREKKNHALNAANDYYLKGKSAEESANIPAAFDLYMRGLFAMKEYWNDINEYSTESGKIYLDNEIYSSMQRISDGMRIKANVPKVVLTAGNRYNQDVTVTVEYAGKPVKGITVMHQYTKSGYMKPKANVSGDNGEIFINVSDASSTEKSNALNLSFNLDPLVIADLDRTIQLGLLKGMRTEKKSVPIELMTPLFHVSSTEKNYGNVASGSILASAMSAELVKSGMRISGSSGETDFLLNITSNTTEGGSSQGFVVAYLEMTVEVTKPATGEVVYRETVPAIKGLQLNKDAASIDAYKKGKERIEQQLVKSILDAIM